MLQNQQSEQHSQELADRCGLQFRSSNFYGPNLYHHTNGLVFARTDGPPKKINKYGQLKMPSLDWAQDLPINQIQGKLAEPRFDFLELLQFGLEN